VKRLFLLALAILPLIPLAADEAVPDKIEFNRDVRPILSDTCFKCHGFDPKHREAKRRIDTREGALEDHDGVRAIVPGKPEESEAWLRLEAKDEDDLMPPKKTGKVLTARQIAIFKKWIEQGAEYQPLWSYAPIRPAAEIRNPQSAIRNGVDDLVQARFSQTGLAFSPEADKTMLIRRLTFDLTGLPPTAAEVTAFAEDASPDAYEKVVARLLASPAYGERMAVYWLDLVRYADSIGFHSDNPRNVSPYRDYVIRTFNENLPFDKFTIENLAGDLLPNASLWQQVASGFNRLNLTTEEGGAQAKDYESRTVADRVRAIGTVWLGQTTGCCQCHDHKYDPFTARDFYRLGAFFADIDEPSIGGRGPGMLVPTLTQDVKLKGLDAHLAALRTALDAPVPEVDAAQAAWEQEIDASGVEIAWTPLHAETAIGEQGSVLTVRADHTIKVEVPNNPATDVYKLTMKLPKGATGMRLEVLPSASLPAQGPGRSANGNFILNEFRVEREGTAFKFAKATATFSQEGLSVTRAIDGNTKKHDKGWAIQGNAGKPSSAYFEFAEPFPDDLPVTVVMTQNYGDNHTIGKFRIDATTAPKPIRAPNSEVPANVLAALKVDAAQRNDAQRAEIKKHFRSIAPQLADARAELAKVEAERTALDATIDRCLVSVSMPQPRVVRILPRGNWLDESGEVVAPGVPAFLPQPPDADKRKLTRLDLAQWLVARENPLTARVFVNRIWKQFFGIGLSKVLDDVGSQGEQPNNPALLDWLAADFVESGWNVKHVVQTIVTSRTYRQTSEASKELQQRDPYNRELARQGRFRLDAEFVRDNALAISGLLVRKVGGRSVNPYQPAGYWENLNFPTREWEPSTDENQWRRGLYTWWQRSYMHPSLLAFDAPSREECTAERTRSNIPQQALVLLNDPTYVEAARVFAARILNECSGDADQRIAWAWREATARTPLPEEIATVREVLDKHAAQFAADPASASAYVKTGLAPQPAKLDPAELAAWTDVARIILNLHETITRS
jgi:hypothetical protein